MKKKLVAAFLGFCIAFSCVGGSFAQDAPNTQEYDQHVSSVLSDKIRATCTDADYSKACVAKAEEWHTKYDREFLKSIVDALTPYIEELGILGLGIDEENNCIVIDVPTTCQMAQLKANIADFLIKTAVVSTVEDGLFVVNKTDLTIQYTASVAFQL